MNELYNPAEIGKTIEQLYQHGDVFEVRVIGNGKKSPIVGCFNSVEILLDNLKKIDLRNTNVYTTLQEINPDLMATDHANKFVYGAEAAKDKDVRAYNWLMIDIDPVRSLAKISSSDTELAEAYHIAGELSQYMSSLGFINPVKAKSGNGAHLLYPISLENRPDNVELVKSCLMALSLAFDTDTCKIDTAVFNPSRVCKLYGTLAQKGTSTEDRPHRMSQIIGDVKPIEVNRRVTLERLASTLPKPDNTDRPVANKYNNYNATSFDVEDFMNRHGIIYKPQKWGDVDKFILDHCPFDESHNKKDAAIFKYPDGSLAFKCFHNSCSDKHWKDVRKLFEPTAYEWQEKQAEDKYKRSWQRYNANKPNIVPDIDGKEQSFLTLKDIVSNNEPDPEYIRTGFEGLDKNVHGLVKGGISVLTGLRGSGKSTFLQQLVLNTANNGYKTVAYSGELSAKMMTKWILKQAAGANHVYKPNSKVDDWEVCQDVIFPIAEWMEGKFWLYNNKLGCKFDKIIEKIQRLIEQNKLDLVILDNLMALDIIPEEVNYLDRYEAQKRFIQMLKSVATMYNVHILYVAHPRKANGYLRLDDVSGTGDLTNMVDLAFVIHKNNKDYQANVTRYYNAEEAFVERREEGKGKEREVYYIPLCHNVIEICKDRESGNTDKLIPLWFEKKCKRFLNHEGEYVAYGWQENYKPTEEEQSW